MTDNKTPTLSVPGHTWRKTKRGVLVEDPFKLVVRDGKIQCVTYDVTGIRIGWDVCGGCGLHLSVCTHDVPVPPAFIEALRLGEPARASYLPTPVQGSERSKGPHQISGIGGSAGISISDLVTDDVVAKVKAAKEARDG